MVARARENKKRFRILQIIIIVTGALVPIVNTVLPSENWMRIISSVLGGIIVKVTSMLRLHKYQETGSILNCHFSSHPYVVGEGINFFACSYVWGLISWILVKYHRFELLTFRLPNIRTISMFDTNTHYWGSEKIVY
jgi:hypothetical protein